MRKAGNERAGERDCVMEIENGKQMMCKSTYILHIPRKRRTDQIRGKERKGEDEE